MFLGFLYFFTKATNVKKVFAIIMQDNTKIVIGRLYLFLKSLAYTSYFKKFSPNEIHVHFLNDSSTIAMVASIILDIPFSINAHARDITQYPTLPVQKAKYAKFITVCNKYAYEKCIEIAQSDNQKIHLIYHGHDKEKLFKYPVTIQKDNTKTNIFAGGTRLTEKKGLGYLIEASKILKEQNIKHKINLIGPGPLYDALIEKIKFYDLSDTFIIHGKGQGLPFGYVSQYYQTADIFALPIINTDDNDVDGIPNTIIEAALAKLPIITTNAGSVGELIEDNVTGLVVEQKNSVMLANAIKKLIDDKDLRVNLGNAAYDKAIKMFDSNTNVGELEKLLVM